MRLIGTVGSLWSDTKTYHFKFCKITMSYLFVGNFFKDS